MSYQALTELIRSSHRIVVFGGAGLSTESGIPDFRGTGGLYAASETQAVPPETILHHNYFTHYPDRFYAYYTTHMLYPDARPNAAHEAFARLEQMGKLSAVITQNIDGLHQLAGSRNVIELHGSTLRNYCTRCGRTYGREVLDHFTDVPRCGACGGIIRPDVVLYGEALDAATWYRAEEAVISSDLLIVGGTSLTVQPAASLVTLFRGDRLVIINRDPTPYDAEAALIIRDPIAAVFREVMRRLASHE